MIIFIIQLILMILTTFLAFLMLLTYRITKIRTLFFLSLGLIFLSAAFMFDVIARASGSYFIAVPLFKLSGVLFVFAFPFLFSYVELSRTIIPRSRYFLYFALSMILLAFILLSDFDVSLADSVLSRSAFTLLIGGINVCPILQFSLIFLFVFEHIMLTRDQYLRFRTSSLKNDLFIELLLFDVSLALLLVGLIGVLLGLFSPDVLPIAMNLSMFTTIFAFTFALIRNPYLTYLVVQRVYGVLIFTRDGLLIIDYVVSEELDQAKELIAGFLSAIISAIKEVIRVGDIRAISMSNMDVVMDVGDKVVTTIFVDRAVSIHWTIARKITQDIESLEIPPVIDSDFEAQVLDMIMDHLKPLFG